MEITCKSLEGGAIDRLLLAPLPLAAGELGFGLMKRCERLLPLGLKAAGDEAIFGIDGAVAAFGLLCREAPTLDIATPLAESDIIVGLEPFRSLHCGSDTGRRDGSEDRLDDGVVDLHAANTQAIDTTATDDVLASAMVARCRSCAAIMGAQSAATVTAGGDALKQGGPFPDHATALVRSWPGVATDASAIGFERRPIDIAGVMIGYEHGPFVLGQAPDALADFTLLVDAALVTGAAVSVGAGIDGIYQDAVDGGVGRRAQRISPAGSPRVGKGRPSLQNQSQTRRAEPSSRKRSKTVRMAPLTAASGWKRTSPGASPQTKPSGRPRRSSPRAALLRMPPSSLACRMCSSASDIVPLSPSTRRSLKPAG